MPYKADEILHPAQYFDRAMELLEEAEKLSSYSVEGKQKLEQGLKEYTKALITVKRAIGDVLHSMGHHELSSKEFRECSDLDRL
ncbi:MAG: hypothetical protein HZB65_04505 [Candidatus Aenigmarchaeota archaeon]|nr:hypothetical protein [Candidatus Aenigmarchaeota archaeon]